MNPDVAPAVLLAALEPGISRIRLLAALHLLGHSPEALADAIADGSLRVVNDRLDCLDPTVARRCLGGVGDRVRRTAHLALACTDSGRLSRRESQALFERLGAQLRAPVRQVPLTGRESYVAELAATGATSREIAAAAHLSPKTVETHLSRIYRKLGVRSKAELAYSFAQVAR